MSGLIRADPDGAIKDVEEVFGISKQFLELAALRGDGQPIVRIGRSVRYWPADVPAWIASRREDPGVKPNSGVPRRCHEPSLLQLGHSQLRSFEHIHPDLSACLA